MRILGNTLELISINKAGIFKSNVPALIGPGCPFDSMKVLSLFFIFIISYSFSFFF